MINIIAALTKSRAIGKANKLLCHLPEDLQNFKRLTSGNTVIMGRKTFESLGRPLPNRKNIVISHSILSVPGIDVCHSLSEALEKARSVDQTNSTDKTIYLNKTKPPEIFIIGGASIYQQALPLADKLYLSHLKKDYEGDAYFPELNFQEWEIEEQKEFPEFTFIAYRRRT